MFSQSRRDEKLTQQYAEESIRLCTDQKFAQWLAIGQIFRGWAITGQGQREEGVDQLCEGLAAHESTGGRFNQSYYLTLLADAYGKTGQIEKGCSTLKEALAEVHRTGERRHEAEIYRLKGELLLARAEKLKIESSGD